MIKLPVIKAITATVSALMIFSAVSVSANAASIDNNSKTLSKFQIKTSDNTKMIFRLHTVQWSLAL